MFRIFDIDGGVQIYGLDAAGRVVTTVGTISTATDGKISSSAPAQAKGGGGFEWFFGRRSITGGFMAMNANVTKILASVFGALIIALQGTNIVQGVAFSGTENRLERIEEDLAKAQAQYVAIYKSRMDHIDESLDLIKARLAVPSPSPSQ